MKPRIAIGVLAAVAVAFVVVAAPIGSAAGTPVLEQGVRFQVVGQAPAQPDPTAFTVTSHPLPRGARITEVVLQNPHHDGGALRVQIGTEVLLEVALADVTTAQYHLPLHVRPGQSVAVAVSCQVPGPPEPADGQCSPAVSFFG
jgi:hypothetical protein